MTQPSTTHRNIVNTVLIVMIGQVGCLSIVIIFLSVLGGLWLDNQLGTKPFLTLVLLFAGVPVSIFAMLFVARRTVAKIKAQADTEK
jgi:hypothetical protein